MSTLLNELFFVVLCVIAAFVEKNLFKYNKSFKHWWGITIYFILVGVDYMIFRNVLLCVMLLLIGEVMFSPFLNLIRGHKFFYVNISDPNGSKLDKLEVGIGKQLYFLSLGALITLNIIFFIHGRF